MNDYLSENQIREIQEMTDLEKAKLLVLLVFKDKTDKSGNNYIGHLNRVSEFMNDDDSKAAALLHDLVEDTSFTFEDLKILDFSNSIIEVIRLLTNNLNSYKDFIERIINSDNLVAKRIKIADLLDNMNINRIIDVKKEDFDRIKNKYIKSYLLLLEDLERRIMNDRY